MNSRTKRKLKQFLFSAGRFLLLGAFMLLVLAPIYWLAITSFKSQADINSLTIQYWPANFTLDNYKILWNNTNFSQYLTNSVITSLVAAFIVLVFSLLGGYSLARFSFRGKNLTLMTFLLSQMIPGTLLLIPIYMIFSKMSIINSLKGLILFYVIANLPFCLITMRSFFERIPVSLEEAAMVDGCSKIRALTSIILPIMFPGIVAVFVFAFTGAWNDLLAGLMLTNSDNVKTIPVGLSSFVGKFNIDWGQMTAGAVLSLIPTVFLFAFVQKYVVDGLTSGAVKG